jgi:hypothetical protein
LPGWFAARGPFGVGQPIFRDLAERARHLGDLLGLAADAALLARLEVGGHGLAALLDHAGKVLGKLLDIDAAAFAVVRGGSHLGASVQG